VSAASDVILIAGTVTLANEALFSPAAGGKVAVNWRVIPATGIAAVIVDVIARLSPQLGLGIAVTALITTLFAPLGTAGSPVSNLAHAMGYQ
jgi:hypothetical protein